MDLAEPVKTARGLRFDAFVLRLQEVATGRSIGEIVDPHHLTG
jgi:hypothetical protein